ncbi:MAG: hypothetical protein IT381_05540 [Deltaproteobacteria bacterium]|nr:hypothetical protein [Deltaproteobacteria bacterium]
MRAFVVLSLLCSCAGTTQSVKTKASDYYPLRTGVTWVYKGTFLGQQETRTIVMGAEDQDGFFTDDTGAKLTYDGEGLRDERRYLLREPIHPGAKWQSVAALGVIEKYAITKVHEPCEAPAGKYEDCITVTSELPAADKKRLEATLVYAKTIGLVRLETTLVEGEKRTPQVHMELVQFRP